MTDSMIGEAMTERPIMFTPENVLKILDGKKTQTRRVAKPQQRPDWKIADCPYGLVGDRLWVRETWQYNPYGGIVYKAGSGIIDCAGKGWRPAICMPRWACRLVLEITDVRIERVQDISPDDAKAEGDKERSGLPEYHERGPLCHVDWYRNLWDSINAKRGYGWDTNPLVWAISFRKVD